MSETQTRAGGSQPPSLPLISSGTALFCFSRLSDRELSGHFSSLSGKSTGALSVEEVVGIARHHQLDTKPIQMEWHELRDLLKSAPVVLVLRNGNAVVALESGPSSTEEIVASDPLYRDGDAFFLPRGVLEAAWDGMAFAVKRSSVVERSPSERPFSAARACTLAVSIVPFLLYPIEASREDFAATLITQAAATEVIQVLPPLEAEATVGETGSPADSARSALVAAHIVTEHLTEQKSGASEQESVDWAPAARRLKKSLPWEPAAVAAKNATQPTELRVKSNVTVLRGGASPVR